MTDPRLVSLLHFADSAFPTGGYAHSFGLEHYCQAGIVRDRDGLERFLLTQLEGAAGPCDATAAAGALLSRARIRALGVLLLALAALIYNLPKISRPMGGGAGLLIGDSRSSRINTKYLNATVDREKGEIGGSVVAGQHAGRPLAGLDQDALLAVRSECLANDPDSVPLIEAYIDQMHGTGWRQGAGSS